MVLYKTLYGRFGSVQLELSAGGLRFVRTTSVPLADVGECAVRSGYRLNNAPQYALAELINRKVRELASLLE